MRTAVLAGLLCSLALSASAQDAFPLVGRWTYFDFGARDLVAADVVEACGNSWDSISPDGSFISFSRTDLNDVVIELAGFCEMLAADTISCTYLIDPSGPIVETYTDEIVWVTQDIVDYVVRRDTGKPDVESGSTQK